MSDESLEESTSDKLFDARDRLESLTRSYIEALQTSKESASDHAALLNTILNSIGDGVIVFDKDQNIILANKTAIELAGWNMEQISRHEFVKLYKFFKEDGRTPLPDSEHPFFVAFNEKRKAEVEGLVVGPHLPWKGVFIRALASPVIDSHGEVSGIVTIFSDITERKQLQRQRDTLATLITHDIKNHLAAEWMFLELLAKNFDNKLPETDMDLLNELQLSNQRYLEIVTTLLEIHRTSHLTESSQRSVELVEMLTKVVALNQHIADSREVTLNLDTNGEKTSAIGIPSSLQQALHNVLQNAIYASPKAAAVTLRLSKSDGKARIEIEDKGPGIEHDKIQDIFDQPTSNNPLSTNPKSSGFGLYLSRLLVVSNGGSISCQSTVGEGTVFTIDIPTSELTIQRSS